MIKYILTTHKRKEAAEIMKDTENIDHMEEVYRKHAQTVYRYLLSRTGNSDVSEELTQETFYQAVKSANKFNGSCTVVTWLCAIAKNKLREYERKRNRELLIGNTENAAVSAATAPQPLHGEKTDSSAKRRQAPGSAANLQDTQTVTSAESEIISSENRVELMMALQQLDAGVREVIYMRLFGELSFGEIGEVLGRSENWARVTFYRGKERLKKNISVISKGGTD